MSTIRLERLENPNTSAGGIDIDSSGKVGIGTTSPGAALDVAPDTNRNLQVQGKGGTTYGLELKNGSANSGGEFHITAASSGGVVFNRGATESARIDSSGNVGIGNASPTNKITARGTNASGVLSVLAIENYITTNPFSGNGVAIDFNLNNNGNATVNRGKIEVVNTNYHAESEMRFYTATSNAIQERMRIDSTGTTRVWSTSAPMLWGRNETSGGVVGLAYYNTATSTTSLTGQVFRVMCDGDVENANNAYDGISDAKLKENIIDANSQWNDIKALQVRKYNFKAETGYSTHTQIGLVAQEVELVSPGLVGESIDEETGESTKSVSYSVLYMKAVKALQEAMERIETLEAKVAALESTT